MGPICRSDRPKVDIVYVLGARGMMGCEGNKTDAKAMRLDRPSLRTTTWAFACKFMQPLSGTTV